MNPATMAAAVALARDVAALPSRTVAIGVAPPSIALAAVADALRGSRVAIFAQDVHWADSGAFTGQLAASMLAGIAAGAIVGHSEVRRDQGDDDARVAKKVGRALGAGLRVILCVGESEAQYAAGETGAVIARQIGADLAGAPRDRLVDLVVAYEPIWAIGTGRPATAAHATSAAATIREALARSGADANATPILYGGSVTASGVAEFAKADGIDGALVGGASLRASEFGEIVAAFDR
jgi:triosephosphate isomerase